VVAALLYINGHTPAPLSPAVILFIINGTDLNCLTPAFIGEWFVNLRKRLLDWLEMGPEGDLQPFTSYFASFHDIEASLYYPTCDPDNLRMLAPTTIFIGICI
jgi:hypothetical protein